MYERPIKTQKHKKTVQTIEKCLKNSEIIHTKAVTSNYITILI